jgi:hypothetical protein
VETTSPAGIGISCSPELLLEALLLDVLLLEVLLLEVLLLEVLLLEVLPAPGVALALLLLVEVAELSIWAEAKPSPLIDTRASSSVPSLMIATCNSASSPCW